MVNVVLVEDEMLVLLGMKMCIQESGQGMRVVQTFSSAEAALKYFNEHTADVLISDIRLKGMTGLELIEKIRLKHKHMLIIVLSCYEDFSYARKAYEIGIDKYILKQELVEDQLADIISELFVIKKSQHAASFAYHSHPVVNMQTSCLEGSNKKYRIGLITLREQSGDSQSKNEEISFPMAAEIVQEILYRDQLGECFLRHSNELFCIFHLDKKVTSEEMKATLQIFFDNMSKNISNYFNRYAFMTISDCFTDLRNVKKSFEEVKHYSSFVFYLDKPCILWAEQNKFFSVQCPEIVFDPQGILSDHWISEFESYFNAFFKEQAKAFVSPSELKIQVVKYMNELSSFFTKYYDIDINQVSSKETRPNYLNINGFASIYGLRNWLIKMGSEVREYILVNDKKETTIARIIEYIEQNYNASVTLADIADKFHMNAVYVSQLFKRKTGVTFTHYVNRLRIEKAKALLISTDLTAKEIGEQIGIRNSNYFSRLFKKITGRTVNQYRKSLK